MLYIAIAGGLLLCRESSQRSKKVVEGFIHKPPCPCMGEEQSPEKGVRSKLQSFNSEVFPSRGEGVVAILVFSSELFGLLNMAPDLQSGPSKTSKLL
jgi:hypothetical protein